MNGPVVHDQDLIPKERTLATLRNAWGARGFSPLVPALVGCIVLGISDPALAVSLDVCRAEVEHLHGALPGGITDTWASDIRERLDHVNSIPDREALQQSFEQVWAESDAYDRNPDPDGDGYALAPEVFTAAAILWNCLHRARGAELAAGDNPMDGADAEGETAASDEGADTVERNLTTPPTKIEGSGAWFAAEDFPQSAIDGGRQGEVRYHLTIGTDGRVLGCEASGPPNSADLEAATCTAILARARLNPAKDAAGTPVVGKISGSVHW
jgi:hypothetical protein